MDKYALQQDVGPGYRLLSVVSGEQAATHERHNLTALRGVFGFETNALRGTLTVSDGSAIGFARLIVYSRRVDAGPERAPVRMEAEVREGWIQQVTAGCDRPENSVYALLASLFEIASITDQRTVRITAAAS